MNKLKIAGGAVALALGLAACSSETAAPVVSESVPVEITDEAPSVEEAAEAPNADTVPVGTTVRVGDWDVVVTKVAKSANKAIAKANSFNDKPEGQYVLVTYKATYQGEERKSDVGWDLSWSFTGSDQVSYDEALAVTPAEDMDAATEARKGGTITSDVAFDVPSDVIKGAIISVEGYDSGFNSFYADFTF